ncbi:MAG: MATE family efflux transporter [Succinivibrio sp.]|nr:MATE family efflux transporter [Succinivibrio sp.]
MSSIVTITELLKRQDPQGTEIMQLVLHMSLPAILSQLTFIAMQYIDAAMVGSLGAQASAAVGLVSSATWLIFGLTMASTVGFSILTAQHMGAGRLHAARFLTRQALMVNVIIGLGITSFGLAISSSVPFWMGGSAELAADAGSYFKFLMLSMPFFVMRILSSSLVQATGNMKVPSLISASTCLLDILFNFLFILPSRSYTVSGFTLFIPGAGLGVTGAALGTVVAEVITSLCIVIYLVSRSELRLTCREPWKFNRSDLISAFKLGIPVGLENAVMTAAMVATTRIIAPLGTVALAANIFAIEAEGLCYMPGYGIGAAISPIIGQCLGAKRFDLLKRCANYGIMLGAAIMGLCGIIMYFACPLIFILFTPDLQVRELGVSILRIEMLAEPMFGVSIVTAAVLRGAGDTLIPSSLNALSIWGIRISLCLLLVPLLGLTGAWIAMCIELCCRGGLMLIRFRRKPWLKHEAVA